MDKHSTIPKNQVEDYSFRRKYSTMVRDFLEKGF